MRTEQEFWSNVDVGEQHDCWPWRKCRNEKGYGIAYWVTGGKSCITRAHRIAFSLANHVPLPKDAICHHCDNPACCNPSHLWLGTVTDNNRDMWSKGRGKIPEGRKFKSCTLPDEVTQRIGTLPDYLLASECGVNKTTIARRRRKLGIAPFAATSGSNGRFKPGNYPARWRKVVTHNALAD